jgi:hypothetical protein
VRVPPASMAFTLLLSFLVALPSFGIDMSLPALTAMGAALHVSPARAGLLMSLFMLGFAVAPRSVTVILQPVLCLGRPVGQFSGWELFPTNRPTTWDVNNADATCGDPSGAGGPVEAQDRQVSVSLV